jgi:hypothetical protein
MNVGTGTEAALFPEKEYVMEISFAVWDDLWAEESSSHVWLVEVGWGVRGRTSINGMAKAWKILAILELFLESQNHREKFILWGRNWIHWTGNFLQED